MKVFLVGDFPKDDKTYTGVQGVLVNLVNELIERAEIELVLISLSPDCDLIRFESYCKTYKLNLRSSLLKAKKEFNKIVCHEKPEIIHLQDVVPGVLLYKKEYRNIFIVTQHAVLKEEILWQVSLKRKMLFRLKELIEKYYFRSIQNMIFISEYNKNIYLENVSKNRNRKYELIPNPVNEIFIQETIPVIQSNKNKLYFVGEIKKRKGLHVLILALDILKKQGCHCELHVIGGFKEKNYEKEIVHLVESLKLTKNIIFSGWKNQEEIMKYSEDISVFVLPSFQETLPLSIAEAMCLGKVVVATNICGIPEMIDNGVSGYLFEPGDFKGLAEILKNIFGNINKQKNVTEKAREIADEFNSKSVVDKTINFYKSLLT